MALGGRWIPGARCSENPCIICPFEDEPSDSAIILDYVDSLNSAGHIISLRPLKFNMRWKLLAGSPVTGFQNGFRVYSPDGATWDPIHIDTVSHGWTSMFDMYFNFQYRSVTGTGADTAAVEGVAMMGSGIVPPFDTQVWWIETQ